MQMIGSSFEVEEYSLIHSDTVVFSGDKAKFTFPKEPGVMQATQILFEFFDDGGVQSYTPSIENNFLLKMRFINFIQTAIVTPYEFQMGAKYFKISCAVQKYSSGTHHSRVLSFSIFMKVGSI